MNNDTKISTIIIKYVVATVIGALFVITALWLRDFTTLTEKVDIYKALADAFTIPGVIFPMVALLILLTNEGSLAAIGWMVKRAFTMLIPSNKKEFSTYKEYYESRKKITGFMFILFVGLAYLLVGIIFTILFFKHYNG